MNIKLNASEYAFIMDIPSIESKKLFKDILDVEKLSADMTIDFRILNAQSGRLSSLDPRFDKKNKLEVYMAGKSNNFRSYLSCQASIKQLKFSGGKSFLHKVLSKEDLEIVKESFKRSFIHKYGEKRYHDRNNK